MKTVTDNRNWVPEITFFQVDQEEKCVHVQGDLQYDGDGFPELMSFYCTVEIDDVDRGTLYDHIANCSQYYKKLTYSEANDLVTGFFEKPVPVLDLFSVNENTPSGYYIHLWEESYVDAVNDGTSTARIVFSSSEAEEDETEFDTWNSCELVRLFLDFARESGILDNKLRILDVEFIKRDEAEVC